MGKKRTRSNSRSGSTSASSGPKSPPKVTDDSNANKRSKNNKPIESSSSSNSNSNSKPENHVTHESNVVTKRSVSKVSTNLVLRKGNDEKEQQMIVAGDNSKGALEAPVMKLEGHEAAVNGVAFSNSGNLLASCSFDKTIFLWNGLKGCENLGVIKGHQNAVQQVVWFQDDEKLATCSADKTVGLWDVESGESIGFGKYHRSYVNGCAVSKNGIIASASDDRTVRLWDTRISGLKRSVHELKHEFEMTSVCYSNGNDDAFVFTGGIDGVIRCWDTRKDRNVLFEMENDQNCDGIITGLSCNIDNSLLLSKSSDGAACVWDARLFVSGKAGAEDRFKRSLKYGRSQGIVSEPLAPNKQGLLLRSCVSKHSDLLSAGSSDHTVPVWDADTGLLKHRLPGHEGPVLEVSIHPSLKVIASCSLDGTIFVGEI